MYPRAVTAADGLALDGTKQYRIHFAAGKTPPVDAFWSVTVYGPDMFLVPNPANRYSISGDTPGLVRNTDGSLDLFVQHTRRRPGRELAPGTRGSVQPGHAVLPPACADPRRLVRLPTDHGDRVAIPARHNAPVTRRWPFSEARRKRALRRVAVPRRVAGDHRPQRRALARAAGGAEREQLEDLRDRGSSPTSAGKRRAGFALTDEIQVTIAAQAALLVLGLGLRPVSRRPHDHRPPDHDDADG